RGVVGVVRRQPGPVVGGLDAAGQHRRLGHGQLRGVLAEVRFGGGLDAVGSPAEVDGVEVVVEDDELVLGAVQLVGHGGFLQLAAVGRLVTDAGGRAHVLLGDGGGTLSLATGEVVDRGAHDAGEV